MQNRLAGSLLAIAAIALTVLAGVTIPVTGEGSKRPPQAEASGKNVAWQEYRSEELGFRVEMPGKVEIRAEDLKDDDDFSKLTSHEASLGSLRFSLDIAHHRLKPSDPGFVDRRLNSAPVGLSIFACGWEVCNSKSSGSVKEVGRFTTNGCPGRDLVAEWMAGDFADGNVSTKVNEPGKIRRRVIVCPDREFFLDVSLSGNPNVEFDMAVERFIKSFAVLPKSAPRQ